MLRIRLTRTGKKHQPSYRVVVTPKQNPVQGQYLDLLGTYNPLKDGITIDAEKTIAWLNKGAQPSERMSRLLAGAGIQHKLIIVKHYEPKPKQTEETAQAPAAAEASAPEPTEDTAVEAPEPEVAPEAIAEVEAASEVPTENQPEATETEAAPEEVGSAEKPEDEKAGQA